MTFVIVLPSPLDPATDDDWGDTLNTALNKIDAEFDTRTVNQDYADFELQRPTLIGEHYALNALGNTSGSFTVDLGGAAAGHEHLVSLTLTGDATLSVSNVPSGSVVTVLQLFVSQDGTGNHTLTFPAAFVNFAGSTFTIGNDAANTMTEVVAYTLDNGTTWYTVEGFTWS
jgi:hypothetical protein